MAPVFLLVSSDPAPFLTLTASNVLYPARVWALELCKLGLKPLLYLLICVSLSSMDLCVCVCVCVCVYTFVIYGPLQVWVCAPVSSMDLCACVYLCHLWTSMNVWVCVRTCTFVICDLCVYACKHLCHLWTSNVCVCACALLSSMDLCECVCVCAHLCHLRTCVCVCTSVMYGPRCVCVCVCVCVHTRAYLCHLRASVVPLWPTNLSKLIICSEPLIPHLSNWGWRYLPLTLGDRKESHTARIYRSIKANFINKQSTLPIMMSCQVVTVTPVFRGKVKHRSKHICPRSQS